MKRRDFIELSGKAFCACSLTGAGFLLNGCSENNIVADTTGIELSFDLNEESFQALKINGGSVVTSPNDIDPEGLLLLRSDENIKAFIMEKNKPSHIKNKGLSKDGIHIKPQAHPRNIVALPQDVKVLVSV